MEEIIEYRHKVMEYIISDSVLNEIFEKYSFVISDKDIEIALKNNIRVEKFVVELMF